MKLRSKLHMEPYLLNKYYGGSQSQIKSGVRLPGTAGNYLSSVDSVLNSVTGDIDIRVYAKADDWTPAARNVIIAKEGANPQKAFRFGVETNGRPQFMYTQDGTNQAFVSASVAPTVVDGQSLWLRFTFDVDNGSGQNVGMFYTSTDGITWTPLGATQTATGVVAIADTTAVLEIGSRSTGTTDLFAGTIYYAEVRNGIDGPIVAKFDSSQAQVSGAQLPATINGWTWNGAALYKRDDYVRLPGTSGNYLSYPDTVANSVTGDIDLRAKVSADDWTPGVSKSIMSKEQATGGVRSYGFGIHSSNALKIRFALDGNTAIEAISTVIPSFVDGNVYYVRITRVASTGACNFYQSSDGVTWTPIGAADVASTPGLISDNASIMELGSRAGGGSDNWAGNIYYFEVRNGINGPVVASFNGADNQVQTPWTINGAAWNWEGSSFTGKPGIALSLPGVASNYVSTPDTAGNSILGDIDLRMKVALPDWTPSSTMTFIGKNVGDPNRAFRWTLLTPGTSQLEWWPTGSNASIITKISTVAIPFADGATGWVRVTLDVDNGASGNTVSFYTSIDGVVWTPLGAPVITAGVTTMVDTAAAIEVGANFNGASQQLLGTVYYAEVRNGIDGPIVAKFDPTNIIPTGVRLPTNTVQPGGSPNGLNPNQASIETDATGWVAGVGAPTLAQDATQFLDGTKSLSLVATAAGPAAIGAETTPVTTYPVVANKLYTARASFRTAVTGQLCKVGIHWYTAASASISTSFGSTITDLTSGWTEAVVTALAPATAAYATVQVEVAGALITEKHFIDRISEVESAEVWTLNGSAWNWVAT